MYGRFQNAAVQYAAGYLMGWIQEGFGPRQMYVIYGETYKPKGIECGFDCISKYIQKVMLQLLGPGYSSGVSNFHLFTKIRFFFSTAHYMFIIIFFYPYGMTLFTDTIIILVYQTKTVCVLSNNVKYFYISIHLASSFSG